MALVVAVTAGAQGTTIHEYPWNPDFNNDTYIGSEDLMGLLSTYGTQFGLPPVPCDYDGTPLESFIFNIVNEEIILDSVFIEFEVEDVANYYVIGCPDPITDTVIFANAAMLTDFGTSSYRPIEISTQEDAYGQYAWFAMEYNSVPGTYQFRLQFSSFQHLGFEQDGIFGSDGGKTDLVQIPFPSTWQFEENGIDMDWDSNTNYFTYYANYLHILPYWHYAE